MKWLIKLIFILSPVAVQAYEEDGNQWLSLTAQGIIQSNLGGYIEGQARRSNRQEKVYEYLLRPAFYFKTENSGSFFVGTLKRFDYKTEENENRQWIQWLKSYNLNSFKITTRFRQEYRDLKSVDQISHRSRLMLRGASDEISIGSHWKPFLASELFYNWNDAGSLKKGLQQSRNSIGAGTSLGSMVTLEASYMLQILNNSVKEDQLNHNLVLGFNFNI
ncbi:MAG: DUF2490 domain-containing protein [Moraxellaceae bacterium]|nr:DUF2490 domain-containing protein [Pseudobdellovibrionaceae bacterium]